MTSCCKPCDTQPRTALSIIPVSPGLSGHFFKVNIMKVLDCLVFRMPTWPVGDVMGITQNAAGEFVKFNTEGKASSLCHIALEGLPILEDNGWIVSKDEYLTAKGYTANQRFVKAAEPLMKYLAENHNPHASIIITSTTAELVIGEMIHTTDEFLKD